MADEYGKAKAKKFKTGRYTATQTGARQEAELRNAFQTHRAILDAAGAGTGSFEDVIAGKKPRPTRSKR